MVMTAAGVQDLGVMWKIASAFRGGPEQLREKPYFIQYGEPVSPLQHAPEVLDKLLFCADWGIPLIYSPAPIAGATAPITHAGHIVQAVAESLFGVVIHQLRRPGSPLLTGMGPVKLDMNTVQALYNSAEYYTTYLGITEMAKWMDIPNWGYAGTSDSQCVDANAGIDITELTLLSMQAGSNLNHDIGYLDFGLTGAGELVVLTDEVISMNRRALEGIEVSEETLALDVIAEVGQGGDFLGKKHTKRHVRKLQWRPTLLDRQTQKNWETEGSLDATEKAHRKLVDIMTNHKPEPLSADMKKTMDELVDGYAAAGAYATDLRAGAGVSGTARAVLDDEGCRKIHEAALRLLEEVGCAVLDPEALALLTANGARVDGGRAASAKHSSSGHAPPPPRATPWRAGGPSSTCTSGSASPPCWRAPPARRSCSPEAASGPARSTTLRPPSGSPISRPTSTSSATASSRPTCRKSSGPRSSPTCTPPRATRTAATR